MFANSVSPPTGGTSRASSMLAMGGTSRYAVSECQTPPKLIRSCSSFTTGMISGYSSSPFTNGYSMISAACAPMGPAGAAASIRRSPSQIAMGTSARRPYHVVDEARPDLRGAGAVSLHRAVPRSLDGDHRLQARARPLLDARHSFLVLRAADAQIGRA